MLRRTYQIGLGIVVLLLAGTTASLPQAKLPRLCFLTFDPGSAQTPSQRFQPFFAALAELNYVHGRTIVIDYLTPEGRSDQFPKLVDDCLRNKPDVIAAATTPAALAAKAATNTVPIIMVTLADPIRTGLVSSLAAPGGNVTGMSNMAAELAAKRLSFLKEAAPSLSRVLVLTHNADPISQLQAEAMTQAAPSLGLTLLFQDIKTAADIVPAFEAGVRLRADGLIPISASIFAVERKLITDLAQRYRLPAIYAQPTHVAEVGGLMAYHASEPDVLRRAANYVEKVLKGSKPADLPVQQPTTFKLIVNLRTAKTLGLTLPPTLLAIADEVIE